MEDQEEDQIEGPQGEMPEGDEGGGQEGGGQGGGGQGGQGKRKKRHSPGKLRAMRNALRPSGLAKQGGKQAAKQLAKQAAKQAAMAAARGAVAFFATPLGWITLAVIIVLFLILIIIMAIIQIAGHDGENDPCKPAESSLSLTKTGPEEAKSGDDLKYKITVSNSDGGNITITDKIPEGTEFKSADHDGKNNNGTVTWTLKGDGSVSVTLKATKDNTHIINYAQGEESASSSASTGGGSVSGSAWNDVLAKGKQYGPKWVEFLNAAKKVAEEEDYPIAVIVAQGALESGHGTSALAKGRNAFFGVNAVDSNPNAATGYASPEESIRGYVKLIKTGQRYKEAYAARKDPKKMVELIKAAGYASDPAYVNKVTNTPEFQALSGIGSVDGGGGETGGCDSGSDQRGGAAGAGGYVPPSGNTCGGKYNIGNNPMRKNFGDPACTFSKDKLKVLLKKKDPERADLWFRVVGCESTFNPVAHNPNTPDAAGAWGFFQMGSSKPPGKAPPAPGKNGKYDRGDVNWEMQLSNAITYLKTKNQSPGDYWQCAR